VVSRFEEVWFDGVDDMLEDARSRLTRVSARAATPGCRRRRTTRA
jgi:hypothetical protein